MPTPEQVVNDRRVIGKAIARAVSAQQLDSFKYTPEDLRLTTIGRYAHDVAIAQAFYPLLRLVEVSLRNNVFRAIETMVRVQGIAQGMPQAGETCWLDANRYALLLPDDADEVRAAKVRLARAHKPIDAGHLLSAIHLGFWVNLFSGPYAYQGSAPVAFWPAALRDVFPHAPAAMTAARAGVGAKLNQMKALRNRVFHHNPIWKRNLGADHVTLLELLEWMSPPTARAARFYDRLPVLMQPRMRTFLERDFEVCRSARAR